jgi:uncharacterized protein (DUF697 family)
MDRKSRWIKNIHASVAAVTSFLLAPIPAADELIVVPMHFSLVKRMAKARKVPIESLPWKSIKKIIWYGAGVRLLGNISLGEIPIAGSFANSFTAVVLTEFLARWLDLYLTDPANPPKDITAEVIKTAFENAMAARAKRRANAEPATA